MPSRLLSQERDASKRSVRVARRHIAGAQRCAAPVAVARRGNQCQRRAVRIEEHVRSTYEKAPFLARVSPVSYACPEPVLINIRLLVKNGAKRRYLTSPSTPSPSLSRCCHRRRYARVWCCTGRAYRACRGHAHPCHRRSTKDRGLRKRTFLSFP